VITSSTNKHPVVFDGQILSSFIGRLQHHHSILFVVHLELAKRHPESITIDLVVDHAMNPQIFPRLQALDSNLIIALSLDFKLSEIPLSSVMSHAASIRWHPDGLELLEVAIMAVLDHHGVVQLEFVQTAKWTPSPSAMVLSVVLTVMLSSSSSTVMLPSSSSAMMLSPSSSAMMLSMLLTVVLTMLLTASSRVPPDLEFTQIPSLSLMETSIGMKRQVLPIIALQFDNVILSVVHCEITPRSSVALGIHSIFVAALHSQVLSGFDILELEMSTVLLAVPLRPRPLLAVESHLVTAILFACDRVESLEVAVTTVLDHHGIVQLELVLGIKGHGAIPWM